MKVWKKYAACFLMLAIFETIAVALWLTKDNKPMRYFSRIRVTVEEEKCVSCGKCKKVCPMNVDMTDNARSRKNGTECIPCMECVDSCPKKALKA